MNTHVSYKCAKMLKKFLGESAMEPIGICSEYYGPSGETLTRINIMDYPGRNMKVPILTPKYMLHDLLSKPFCEAFTDACERVNRYCPVESNKDLSMELAYKYFFGGLPAVEKALMKMMENK